MMTADVAPRRVNVPGLGDHLKVGLGLEQEAQAAAYHRVVIGDDDPDRRDLCAGGGFFSA